MLTSENLRDSLSERLNIWQIRDYCGRYNQPDRREELFGLIFDEDDRVAYNALWTLTHFPADQREWMQMHRDRMIDHLLKVRHVGRRRLILTLLEALPVDIDGLRTDYLDFCLAGINSTEPYAVRALCMKQAYAQSIFYPELMHELMEIIDMMDHGALSPGLVSLRRRIMKTCRSRRVK